jgi:hypothetical protein
MKNSTLLVALVLISGLVVSYLYNYHSNNIAQLNQLMKNSDFEKNRLKASHELRSLEFKHQGFSLNLAKQCKRVTGEVHTLSDVIKGDYKLVFCIPESVCNTCHENTFNQLNMISNVVGVDNIIVLVDSPRLRATVVDFKDRKSNIEVLGVNYKELNFDIHYVPFLFILSDKAACENMFVPNSFDPQLTISYIYTIKNRYFL